MTRFKDEMCAIALRANAKDQGDSYKASAEDGVRYIKKRIKRNAKMGGFETTFQFGGEAFVNEVKELLKAEGVYVSVPGGCGNSRGKWDMVVCWTPEAPFWHEGEG